MKNKVWIALCFCADIEYLGAFSTRENAIKYIAEHWMSSSSASVEGAISEGDYLIGEEEVDIRLQDEI